MIAILESPNAPLETIAAWMIVFSVVAVAWIIYDLWRNP